MNDRWKSQFNAISAQLRADKKKTAALCGLFLVLLGLVGGRWVSPSTPPEVIAAAPVVRSPEPSVRPVVQAVVPAPRQGAGQPPSDFPAPPAAGAVPKAVSVAGMPRVLYRDPFSTDAWDRLAPSLFSNLGGAHRDPSVSESPFWARLASAMLEHRRVRRREVESLRKELGDLRLQSTMTGPKPLAYISGRLVREGESLRGFSVLRIQNRRVLLRRDGYELELAMP